MFELNNQLEISLNDVPIQWIPKIELYYPDLPQFPIMYIHFFYGEKRIIVCPVAVSYEMTGKTCKANFHVLTNEPICPDLEEAIKLQISNRIGLSDKISKETIINSCKGNADNIALFSTLWEYIENAYGDFIPYGKFFEEIFSIVRFVAAWQPKTGRQSEMRMLYNFMSTFGEQVELSTNWKHLEYYVIPNYIDVQKKDYSSFPTFLKLYNSIKKIYNLEFTKEITIDSHKFKVLPKAWKQNKDDFIKNISNRYFISKKITESEKIYCEKLVDAFNRHSWRAAYFISSLINIESSDYKSWSKDFFISFYENGSKLKGYSEKVYACFLQQGFKKDEIIPIDTWIETFYRYTLGIDTRIDFYTSFDKLGKIERVIWLASQSNKTNMRGFYNILWCQRYGTIGNKELRGINPLACSLCKLNKYCVGLKKFKSKKIILMDDEHLKNLHIDTLNIGDFICLLDNYNIPKKIYVCREKKKQKKIDVIDEFSGYQMTSQNNFDLDTISKETITFDTFIKKINKEI